MSTTPGSATANSSHIHLQNSTLITTVEQRNYFNAPPPSSSHIPAPRVGSQESGTVKSDYIDFKNTTNRAANLAIPVLLGTLPASALGYVNQYVWVPICDTIYYLFNPPPPPQT